MMPLNFYGPKSGCSLFSPSFPSILFSVLSVSEYETGVAKNHLPSRLEISFHERSKIQTAYSIIREGPNSPVYFNRLMNDWWVKIFFNL